MFPALKWVIILSLAVVELGFDFGVEPWLRAIGGWEEVAEHYLGIVELLAIGAVVWFAFTRLEGVEHLLKERHDEIEGLYHETHRREKELAALYDAALATGRAGQYPSVLQVIVDVAKSLVGAHYGALAELDDRENLVEFVTAGVSPEVRQRIGAPPTHQGLLKRLSGERPVRLTDIAREPDMTGLPPHHPPISSFLGAPIRSGGALLGHLYLGRASDVPFTERDEHVLGLFAQQAAVAIDRARVERQRAEVLRVEQQQLVAAQLHDGALQLLYAVGIQLSRARRKGVKTLTESMTTSDAMGAIEKAMAAIRGELEALNAGPPETPWARLVKTVENVASLFGVTVNWSGVVPGLTEAAGNAFAQCLAEFVSNAARHGLATSVDIWTDTGPSGVVFRFSDNGRGLSDGVDITEGDGLRNVRRRLAGVGAEMRVEPATEGMSIRIDMPSLAIKAVRGGP